MASRAKRRYAARLAAVQALYQIDMDAGDAASVIDQFVTHRLADDPEKVDLDWFREIVDGAARERAVFDEQAAQSFAAGRTLARLGATLRSVLRAATFELLRAPDIPAPVIIDEYVNLGRRFCGDQDAQFVNAVLDNLARRVRPAELPEAVDPPL